jgi:mono/diheme cytochrome c family protein
LRRIDDPSIGVRRQLAISVGELPPAARVDVLARVLDRYGDDPVVVDAAVSGLQGHEVSVLRTLLGRSPGQSKSASSPTGDAITMVAAAGIRGGREAEVMQVFQWIAEANRPAVQRLALVQGIEAALAISRPVSLAARAAGTRLKLTRRPSALNATVKEGGEVGTRVTRVLPLLEWPGKPRAHENVRPLRADEQQRFSAGQQVFQTICAPCHQPDGRGRTNVAPSLVGSKWVLGRAGLTARIVLNGKDGKTLMPPVALSDDQMAAVLTYIRRAWGHTASTVDVSLVREVRGASTGRQRPWTEGELLAVTQPDGAP